MNATTTSARRRFLRPLLARASGNSLEQARRRLRLPQRVEVVNRTVAVADTQVIGACQTVRQIGFRRPYGDLQ